jgi:hypothetical protein
VIAFDAESRALIQLLSSPHSLQDIEIRGPRHALIPTTWTSPPGFMRRSDLHMSLHLEATEILHSIVDCPHMNDQQSLFVANCDICFAYVTKVGDDKDGS